MRYWISCRAASTYCSGDLVEHIELGECRHAIFVGDVAGHGQQAADAANALGCYVRRLVVDGVPLRRTLQLAGEYFARTLLTDEAAFASIFLAVADLRKATLRYVSAGHEPALLFSGDGTAEHLNPTGPILGVARKLEFQECLTRLPDDNLFVVVTDGITEARREEHDGLAFFGSQGVIAAIHGATRDGRNPAEAVCCCAVDHAGGELTDDASVFVASLTPERSTSFSEVRATPRLHRARRSLVRTTGVTTSLPLAI